MIKILFLMKRIYYRKRQFIYRNKTPLHWVVYYNSREIGELLLSKGADVNVYDIDFQNVTIIFLIMII